MPVALSPSPSTSPPSPTVTTVPYDPSQDPIKGPSKVPFSPAAHLAYEPPSHRYTLSELGLPTTGTTDFSCTEPFRLCTPAAVLELRRELLQARTVRDRMHWWHRAPCTLRGNTPQEAPFTWAFWNHPDTLRAVSDAAGVDLVPCLPYEIGHTNVQIGLAGRAGVADIPLHPTPIPPESSTWDTRPIDDWHKDSFPYVCVLMLSDASQMTGGETAIRLGDGRTKLIRGPQLGTCTVMQGRHTPHSALRVLNTGERVVTTCSYRPADPALRDDTVIENSMELSYVNELQFQYARARLGVLAEKAQWLAGKYDARKAAVMATDPGDLDSPIIDREETRRVMEEMIWHLKVTMNELELDDGEYNNVFGTLMGWKDIKPPKPEKKKPCTCGKSE